jgi:hypothetical protein
MPNGSGIDTQWLSPARTLQGEDMAACRDGTEEMMSKRPEERLNILPTSFALQMSSQKANEDCRKPTLLVGKAHSRLLSPR